MPRPLTPSKPDTDLRLTLDRLGSQVRLSELEAEYSGPFFDRSVLDLVREGEVSLLAIGESVVIRRE